MAIQFQALPADNARSATAGRIHWRPSGLTAMIDLAAAGTLPTTSVETLQNPVFSIRN